MNPEEVARLNAERVRYLGIYGYALGLSYKDCPFPDSDVQQLWRLGWVQAKNRNYPWRWWYETTA